MDCVLYHSGSFGFWLLLSLRWCRRLRLFLNGLHDLMLVGSLLRHQLRPLTGGERVRSAPQPLTAGGRHVLVSQG